MQFKNYHFIVFVLILNCSSVKNTGDLSTTYSEYSEGIQQITSSGFPFESSTGLGIAKLFRGNSNVGNGVFISNDGLVLTNYSNLLEQITLMSLDNESIFETGYIASDKASETPLEGIRLLIEIEQLDVTDEIKKDITELSPNIEIYQSIQNRKNLLISERRAGRSDLLVEIKDSYSGNKHILTVYLIVDDIRLVYSPAVDITSSNLNSSNHVADQVIDKTALIRAYTSPDGSSTSYSADNIPLKPGSFFDLSNQAAEDASFLTVVGFPATTYKLETGRAINFYYKELNPTIVSSYEILLKKEEYLSDLYPDYALKSIPNRFSVHQEIQYFNTVQHLISSKDVIGIKDSEEEEFLKWIESDSTLPENYSEIFNYINSSYDIAEQTSDIFYRTNYFRLFSTLDNLAEIFTNYLTKSKEVQDSLELTTLQNETLYSHQQLLSQINIPSELLLLKNFMPTFIDLPENEQPLYIYDIFNEVNENDVQSVSNQFIDEHAANSFLFNTSFANQAIATNTLFSDPLFTLLDEINFSNMSAQQSFALHYSFLFPAQQAYTRARLQKELLFADANGSLAYNLGILNKEKTDPTSPFFYTTNDFSGKAYGNAILNQNGALVGIVSDEINESILGNYIYSKDSSLKKGIRIASILDELSATTGTEHILEEISPN